MRISKQQIRFILILALCGLAIVNPVSAKGGGTASLAEKLSATTHVKLAVEI